MKEDLICNLYWPLHVLMSQYFKFEETLWNAVCDKLFIMWASLLIRQMLYMKFSLCVKNILTFFPQRFPHVFICI